MRIYGKRRGRKAGKHFFFEKKKQKTLFSSTGFTMPAPTRIVQPAQEVKVFWFFF